MHLARHIANRGFAAEEIDLLGNEPIGPNPPRSLNLDNAIAPRGLRFAQ